MENITIAINAVLPMFLVIGLGLLVRRSRIISDEALRQANGVCFRFFMFTLMFYNVYTADLGSAFNSRLLAFCVLGLLAEFLVSARWFPASCRSLPPGASSYNHAFGSISCCWASPSPCPCSARRVRDRWRY